MILLLSAAVLLAMLSGTASAGLLEAEPVQSVPADDIPAIVPETTIAPTTWSMPQTFRATKGGTYQLVEVNPPDRTLPTIFAQSAKPDVVSVNDRGEIVAKEIGKTIVTVKAQDGAMIKCGVEVVHNAVARKKAQKGAPGEVVTSTKTLAYRDGKLVVEVFVLNRTGTTIHKAEGLMLQLRRGGTVLFERPIPTWKSKKGFSHGEQKVHHASLSREELSEFTDELLDLGSGEYEAVIVGWDVGRAAEAESIEAFVAPPSQIGPAMPAEVVPVAPPETD